MFKIIFFGTSKYCLPVLEALKPQLELVVVMPDRPVGRHAYRQAGKQILTPCATKIWARENKIPIATFDERFRAECSFCEGKLTRLCEPVKAAEQKEWRETSKDVDLGIVADFGQMISEKIFSWPRLGTFNIHFSKLPDLRGASPVQQTLLRGDKTAWVTIFKIEKTLDTGPILDQREFPILPDDTTESLYTRLFQEVSKYITALDFSQKLTPQTGTPTYCKLLTRQDGFVEWSDIENCKVGSSAAKLQGSLQIENYARFRAFSPWPGLWTIKNGRRMKILKCHLEEEKLVLDEIQFEGKKPKKILSASF